MRCLMLLILSFFIFSCSSVKKVSEERIVNNGWVNSSKFIINSIGYPNSYYVNNGSLSENKESAYNAALSLSKIKIENALFKELPENYAYQEELKKFIEDNIVIESSNYVDNRYYIITAFVEYDNLLTNLREGKKIIK